MGTDDLAVGERVGVSGGRPTSRACPAVATDSPCLTTAVLNPLGGLPVAELYRGSLSVFPEGPVGVKEPSSILAATLIENRKAANDVRV